MFGRFIGVNHPMYLYKLIFPEQTINGCLESHHEEYIVDSQTLMKFLKSDRVMFVLSGQAQGTLEVFKLNSLTLQFQPLTNGEIAKIFEEDRDIARAKYLILAVKNLEKGD